MNQPSSQPSVRLAMVMACIVSIVFCLLYGYFRSSLPAGWLRSNGGGVPYVVFWIFFFSIVFTGPRLATRVCVAVVLGTCLLEVLQLWNPEPLASFRRTRFGAALLGSTFVWRDFPPYFMGGLMGWVCLSGIYGGYPGRTKVL